MPIRVAAALSSATQRIAQPIRVFCVKPYSAAIMTAETATVMMVA